MKRMVVSASLCLFAVAMLLPVIASVNIPTGYFSVGAKVLRADGGAPLPPPPKLGDAAA